MDDGTLLQVNPSGSLEILRVGKNGKPKLRFDPRGRVRLASNADASVLYVFSFGGGDQIQEMVDSDGKVFRFVYGPDARVKELFLPGGERRRVP